MKKDKCVFRLRVDAGEYVKLKEVAVSKGVTSSELLRLLVAQYVSGEIEPVAPCQPLIETTFVLPVTDGEKLKALSKATGVSVDATLRALIRQLFITY